jgi:quercetin dioxygenase-like cupin family protein
MVNPPQPIRRVVTGHDANGKATVISDAIATNTRSPRPGHFNTLMWCFDTMPVPIDVGQDIEDMGARKIGTYPPVNGTRFMLTEYPPGSYPRRHRTETIDYIMVLSGNIQLYLDDPEPIELHAGDVVIQRGTYHAWVNPGPDVCRMCFVLVDAVPLNTGEAVSCGE